MTATSTATVVAAIDIGASSGRVVAGIVRDGTIAIEVVHRFANGMRTVDGHLRWNLSGLYAEVLTGLAELTSRHPGVVSIGIDTWRWTTACWTAADGCWPSRSRTGMTGPLR